MLEHAAVRRAQDVGEVLALVGAHPRDVRVEARAPSCGSRRARRTRRAARRRSACRRPPPGADRSHDSPPTSAQVGAHPVEVDRGSRDQEDAWGSSRASGGRSYIPRRASFSTAHEVCWAGRTRLTAGGAFREPRRGTDDRRGHGTFTSAFGEGEAAVDALDGRQRRLPRGALRRDHGPLGLGQVHADARPRGPRQPHLRHRARRRRRAHRARRSRAHAPAPRRASASSSRRSTCCRC